MIGNKKFSFFFFIKKKDNAFNLTIDKIFPKPDNYIFLEDNEYMECDEEENILGGIRIKK